MCSVALSSTAVNTAWLMLQQHTCQAQLYVCRKVALAASCDLPDKHTKLYSQQTDVVWDTCQPRFSTYLDLFVEMHSRTPSQNSDVSFPVYNAYMMQVLTKWGVLNIDTMSSRLCQ